MDFDEMRKYAQKLGLGDDAISFTGLLEGKNLVREMATAKMMIVFSNYENFPVVINESFALGVPVIATRVGGIPEYLNKYNGRLINAGDEEGLERELNAFLNGKARFNSGRIKSTAQEMFSSDQIGRELSEMYRSIV
jgi:glycosyltransferase involved in cell wall biosynthesis